MSISRKRPRGRVATVSASEAAKNFGRLVDRVREDRVAYVVERSGTPVARIGPIDREPFTMADLKVLLAETPRADDEYLRALDNVVARHRRPAVRRDPWAR
jgi:prevent-host-death family protein